MKRILFAMAALCTLLVGCSNEDLIQQEPIDTSADSKPIALNLNINRADFEENAESRAVKTDWEAGDVIYIKFGAENGTKIAGNKFIALTYNGSSWNAQGYDNDINTKVEFNAANFSTEMQTSGKIYAFYTNGTMKSGYPKVENVRFHLEDGSTSPLLRFWFDNDGTNYKTGIVLKGLNIPYTFADGTLTADITMDVQKDEYTTTNLMQVSVSGLDNTKTWTLTQKGTGTSPAVSYIYDGFIFRRAKYTTIYSLVSENDDVNNKILLSDNAVVGIPRSNGTETHQTFYFYQTLSSSAQGFKFVISDGTNSYEWSGSNVVNDCKAVLLKGPGLDTDGNILEGQDHGWKTHLPGLVDNGDGTGTLNGHAWVDLGQKTSDNKRLVFATTNIGAENPEDAGLYFWWGDIKGHAVGTDGKTVDEFSFEESNCGSWNNNEYVGAGYILKPKYDAATQLWGEGWRMVTLSEFQKISNDPKNYTSTTVNDVSGYKYTLNGQSIFIPIVGDVEGNQLKNTNLYLYWTSTTSNSSSNSEIALRTDNQSGKRHNGYPIRPVAVIP